EPAFEKQIQSLVDLFETEPRTFLSNIQNLDSKASETLTLDRLESRTDPIDLLTIELKLRLERKANEVFGNKIRFDRSTFWSLAKYRLKTALVPSLSLNTSAAIFREDGITARSLVLACAAERATLGEELKPIKSF